MLVTARRRHRVWHATVVVACAAAVGRAADTWTWIDVVAKVPIDHGVMVRGPFADAHEKVQLAGPVAVTAADADTGPCFTVYAAAARDAEPERTARVGDAVVELRLGPPAFLLVPARRLRDGEPATEPPRGVYEARPILDPPDAIAGAPEAVGRPAYLCLPVDYRHHFERVPVEAADRGLVIFTARDVAPGAAPLAAADDFGIARLTPRGTGRTAAWLPVRGTVRP